MKVKVFFEAQATIEVDDKFASLTDDFDDNLAEELENIVKNKAATEGLCFSEGQLIGIHNAENDEVMCEW